ncbi:C40 family peptidase [Streptomyces mangrovisoli]|uniref:C40 family peptidase n=1 Tax=Streptomyces mangrovisoli TaxID=1428628 RepID=UPI00062197FA|nr:C40 family peptidase [Streptomyces mangrovisoli]
MSGRLLRRVGTAAVAVCAVALAPLPPAAAAPEPVGTATAESDTATGSDTTAAEPAADAAAAGLAQDGQRSVTDLLTDLQRLYQQAEQATETYDGTEEKLAKQRAEVDRLERRLARARLSLQDSRGEVGRLAREQYQGAASDLSPYLRILLARDPQHALDEGHVVGRLAQVRARTAGRLAGSERTADSLARAARKALDDRLSLAARQKKNRDDVHRRLEEVEKLLASLSPAQRSALAESEKDGVATAQEKLVTSGALGKGADPSAQGDRAVSYALRQLGKPYQWGAEGPRTYDCSGLTSQAWDHAGTTIPRTSEEQWARLPKVPLDRLRPGDLVIYYPQATHVALYLGEGMVVQAPRTGERVKVSPIASNPILGAVRPA